MGKKRRLAKPLGLTVSLLIAPGQAGIIGGILVYAVLVPAMFGETVLTGENEGFVARAGALSLFAPIIGGVITYLIGSPFIVAAWAIVHFAGSRSTILFTGAFALAGALFGALVLGVIVGPQPTDGALTVISVVLGAILSGSVAGASLGPLVSAIGYKSP